MLKDEITAPLLDGSNDGTFPKIDFQRIFNNEYQAESHESQSYYEEHVKSPERLAGLFRTDLHRGLDSNNKADMSWREKMFGNNHLPPEEQHSFFFFVIECFGDPTLRILLIASIVSLIIGILKDGIRTGWIEGTAIFFAVFLVVTISSYMNYDKEQQFVKLNREIKLKNVVVLRDGNEKQISLEDVLVGDILKLRIGDIINVDGLIYGNGKVQMSEAAVTGESDLLKKAPQWEFKDDRKSYKGTPVILSGSEVLDGTGNLLVCAIGSNSFEGRNRLLLQAKNKGSEDDDGEKTPLQQQLTELANNIGNLGFIMAILIGCLMIIKNLIIRLYAGLPIYDSATLDVLVNAFIIAVTVIVVAIPEGLPMAVTIALAYSVQKMKEEHNLVKHIEKSETMGNVNNVCTDKTGTLTLGEMQVISAWIEKKDYRFPERFSDLNKRQADLLYNCIYKNISVVESINEKGETVLNGDMTEKALYKFIKSSNFSIKEKYQGDIILPFKSEYKYMMSIYKDGKGGYILYGKGAPERIGEFFTQFYENNGQISSYADHKAELLKQQEVYADDSIRTLCFGYKTLTKEEVDQAALQFPEQDLDFFKILAKDLIFAFMVGIRDNNRPEVPEAIRACKRAGIIVRMVTGDNINTALAISKDVGIIEPNEVKEAKRIAESFRSMVNPNVKDMNFGKLVVGGANLKAECPIALEGEQFREVCGGLEQEVNPESKEVSCRLKDRERFKKTIKRLRVIARASPEDKFLLVLGLRELKHIVAVTGDGTNDAPALKQADVGFAMGIRGTDIAKGAADIVLLDDSFSSIVTACKFGRNVFDCIRKFIQFQLTTNIVAVFMTLLGGVILKDSPLNAIEMLWVNLIMDSFASLALATESPTDDLLNRKPYKRGGSLLTPMMKINIISQAIFQIITLTLMIFYGDLLFGVPSDRELEHFTWNNVNGYHFTIFFNTFVFMQVFNSINARKLNQNEYNVFSGILGNWYYIGVQAFIVFGQIVLVTFGGRAVRTHALTPIQHLMCIGIAAMTIVVGFFVKLLPFDTTEPATGEDEEEEEKNKKKEQFSFGYRSRGNKIQFYNSMGGSRSRGVNKA